MPGDYRILATIHDHIGMGRFAHHMTPRLIDFAQRNDWLGRQVVDLGCGSGVSLMRLAQLGLIVSGIDQSPEMLEVAKQSIAGNEKVAGHNIPLLAQDIRSLDGIAETDMALALDVLHEFNNLRELEQAFKSIHGIVKSGKLLIFDMFTIEGLIERNRSGDAFEYDSDTLTVFVQNTYDYERQIQRRDYTIFRKQGQAWARQSAFRILRTYPVQGIIGLVQRCGFEVAHVLNTELKPHTPTDSSARVIIIAQKS